MPDRKGARNRRICAACGGRFYLIGKGTMSHDRCDLCMRQGRPVMKAIPEVVQETPTEPAKPVEPTVWLTDANDREVTTKTLQLRLLKGLF